MARQKEKLAVTEREAAAMLSLPCGEFARLVSTGALPRPVTIGCKHKRWTVEALRAVLTGALIEEDEFEP